MMFVVVFNKGGCCLEDRVALAFSVKNFGALNN